MKLSEAIRLGAVTKPQGYGRLHGMDGKSSCALGSALDAMGIEAVENKPTDCLWPEGMRDFLLVPRKCPACNHPIINYTSIIIAEHLNDEHRWTRERIADWVEVIELEQEINYTNTTAKENECQIA